MEERGLTISRSKTEYFGCNGHQVAKRRICLENGRIRQQCIVRGRGDRGQSAYGARPPLGLTSLHFFL